MRRGATEARSVDGAPCQYTGHFVFGVAGPLCLTRPPATCVSPPSAVPPYWRRESRERLGLVAHALYIVNKSLYRHFPCCATLHCHLCTACLLCCPLVQQGTHEDINSKAMRQLLVVLRHVGLISALREPGSVVRHLLA